MGKASAKRTVGSTDRSVAIGDELSFVVAEENHAHYEAAAQDVWREVLRRNDELIRQHGKYVHPAYLEGISKLALPARIPQADELNERLESTGWRVVSVDGYIASPAYADLMASGVFPVSRLIRRREHIDFAPTPDLVHDILGHLPMLFFPEFGRYLKQLASVMVRAVPNALDQEFYEAVRQMGDLKSRPASSRTEVAAAEARVKRVNAALADSASEVTALRRMYVWSIEFGLTGNAENFRAHGAALLSAPAELRAACSGVSRIVPYSPLAFRRENAFSEMLMQYFVARDFSQYQDTLADYEKTMRHRTQVNLEAPIPSGSKHA
jgi:phenylalanine-4-hydroxylase